MAQEQLSQSAGNAGTLFFDIKANLSQLDKDLREAERRVKESGKRMANQKYDTRNVSGSGSTSGANSNAASATAGANSNAASATAAAAQVLASKKIADSSSKVSSSLEKFNNKLNEITSSLSKLKSSKSGGNFIDPKDSFINKWIGLNSGKKIHIPENAGFLTRNCVKGFNIAQDISNYPAKLANRGLDWLNNNYTNFEGKKAKFPWRQIGKGVLVGGVKAFGDYAEARNSGMSVGSSVESALGNVPVFGEAWQTGRNIKNLINGEGRKEYIRQQNFEISQAQNRKTLDKAIARGNLQKQIQDANRQGIFNNSMIGIKSDYAQSMATSKFDLSESQRQIKDERLRMGVKKGDKSNIAQAIDEKERQSYEKYLKETYQLEKEYGQKMADEQFKTNSIKLSALESYYGDSEKGLQVHFENVRNSIEKEYQAEIAATTDVGLQKLAAEQKGYKLRQAAQEEADQLWLKQLNQRKETYGLTMDAEIAMLGDTVDGIKAQYKKQFDIVKAESDARLKLLRTTADKEREINNQSLREKAMKVAEEKALLDKQIQNEQQTFNIRKKFLGIHGLGRISDIESINRNYSEQYRKANGNPAEQQRISQLWQYELKYDRIQNQQSKFGVYGVNGDTGAYLGADSRGRRDVKPRVGQSEREFYFEQSLAGLGFNTRRRRGEDNARYATRMWINQTNSQLPKDQQIRAQRPHESNGDYMMYVKKQNQIGEQSLKKLSEMTDYISGRKQKINSGNRLDIENFLE